MRVGIIGAGVSGLAAAWFLRQGGHDVVVFEAENHVGGRCSTITKGPFVFDIGATSVAPRGKMLEDVMLRQLPTDDLIPINQPIYVHQGLRVSRGDASKALITRFTYRNGNQQLPTFLANGCDVRLGTCIEAIEKNVDGQYRVGEEVFDRLIVSPPAPKAIELLASVGEFRPLQHVSYRPCISIGLGYLQPLPELPYHALIEPEQRHPMTWLSIESQKSPGRAPEGGSAFVMQMSPEFSRLHFGDLDADLINATTFYLERLFGEQFDVPTEFHITRWSFSQPEMTAMFDSVNRPDSSILIAGDSLWGGRVEYAFESGYRAAKLILDSL